MNDDQAGEVPVAFVVKENNSEITEDEVKQFISKQVYSNISLHLWQQTLFSLSKLSSL